MKKFIRIEKVMSMTGLAKSTVWRWQSTGKMPMSIKLSARLTVWIESEIVDWINNKIEESEMRHDFKMLDKPLQEVELCVKKCSPIQKCL